MSRPRAATSVASKNATSPCRGWCSGGVGWGVGGTVVAPHKLMHNRSSHTWREHRTHTSTPTHVTAHLAEALQALEARRLRHVAVQLARGGQPGQAKQNLQPVEEGTQMGGWVGWGGVGWGGVGWGGVGWGGGWGGWGGEQCNTQAGRAAPPDQTAVFSLQNQGIRHKKEAGSTRRAARQAGGASPRDSRTCARAAWSLRK